MGKKILGGLLVLAIVGGAVAGSNPADPDILARLGATVAGKVTAALPNRSQLAGPVTAFKVGDRLPVEEQVRLRIRTDKSMAGTEVEVLRGGATGEVRLRGLVATPALQLRAAIIASETLGVDKVFNELAVPE